MLLARYARGCRLLAELIVRAVAVVASSRVFATETLSTIMHKETRHWSVKRSISRTVGQKNKATHEIQSNLKYPSSYEATEINKF